MLYSYLSLLSQPVPDHIPNENMLHKAGDPKPPNKRNAQRPGQNPQRNRTSTRSMQMAKKTAEKAEAQRKAEALLSEEVYKTEKPRQEARHLLIT